MSVNDINFSVSFVNLPVCLGDTLKVLVEVTNKGRDSFVTLDGAYVHFPGDSYFQDCHEYLRNNQATLYLRPWAYPTIEKLKSTLSFYLYDKNKKLLRHNNIAVQMDEFCGDLFKNSQEKPRNILLFGLAGSSKSSFINSCYSLVCSSIQSNIAISGGHTERVTTELKGYRLANLDNEKRTNIRLWDTWGIEQNNYQRQEFEHMLRGELSNGFRMDSQIRIGDLGSSEQVRLVKDKMQNCVIFFIPANELLNESSSMVQKTIEFVQIATRNGVSAVIAITKVDTSVPAIRTNPTSATASTEIQNMVNRAATLFNLQHNRICPLINYLRETEKNFEVDRVVFRLLHTAASIAEGSYMKNNNDRLKNLIHDIN